MVRTSKLLFAYWLWVNAQDGFMFVFAEFDQDFLSGQFANGPRSGGGWGRFMER